MNIPPTPHEGSPSHDATLAALFAAVRTDPPDTSRAEYGFEARVLARLAAARTEQTWWAEFFGWGWRLTPVFAVVTLMAGLWTTWPDRTLPSDESVSSGTVQLLPTDEDERTAEWLAIEWLTPI